VEIFFLASVLNFRLPLTTEARKKIQPLALDRRAEFLPIIEDRGNLKDQSLGFPLDY